MDFHETLAVRLLFSILIAASCCKGQQVPPPTPSDVANLTGLTTPVEIQFADGGKSTGSGFFYFVYAPEAKIEGDPHWIPFTYIHLYIVTAKHVIQPKRISEIVKFSYAVRVGEKDHVIWHQLELPGKELGRRLHLCPDKDVDVAVVDVNDQLSAEVKQLLDERAQVLAFQGPSSRNFPGNMPIEINPGDDVIVIGYPLGIYDKFNKLPILKTGLLSTPIGTHFDGKSGFLFDFKYYEGLSGSIIISKPTRFYAAKSGFGAFSSPQYLFLGVYQGEWYWNDVQPLRADLGFGWYYYNVEEAIKNAPLIH